jgi:hypothetical protein
VEPSGHPPDREQFAEFSQWETPVCLYVQFVEMAVWVGSGGISVGVFSIVGFTTVAVTIGAEAASTLTPEGILHPDNKRTMTATSAPDLLILPPDKSLELSH